MPRKCTIRFSQTIFTDRSLSMPGKVVRKIDLHQNLLYMKINVWENFKFAAYYVTSCEMQE